jgi:signal transduction histidine kinase
MQNLSTKILKKFMILSLFIFIIIGGISYFWIKELYIEQIKNDLIHDINIIELELKTNENFQKIADEIKKRTSIRVTIIDKDGKVLADSDANPLKMDNHKSRDEIFESTYKTYGVCVRSSKTLHKELLYVAKKIKIKDKEYFLRVAKSFENVYQNFINFIIKIVTIFVLFLGAFIYITYKISDEIKNETNRILSFLKELKNQTNASTITSSYSEEFEKITKILSEVSSELAKKNKKKSKYTAKLKLANRQKDEILSAISHEFKNPISVISGYSQTLIEDKDINLKIRNKFLDKIHSSAMKLSFMIDRLRLFIKLEEDTQPVKYQKTSINDIVKGCMEELKSSFNNREIIFKSNDEIFLEVDKTLFEVAVKNLIENALKYSEDEITITLDSKKLCVKDKGIGIDKKDLDKITTKFYRATSNKWDNSLGIGLSLVLHVINLHKFKLDIDSEKLKGSNFCIIFK